MYDFCVANIVKPIKDNSIFHPKKVFTDAKKSGKKVPLLPEFSKLFHDKHFPPKVQRQECKQEGA